MCRGRELSCIDVLLSAGSAKDGKGGGYTWESRKSEEQKDRMMAVMKLHNKESEG